MRNELRLALIGLCCSWLFTGCPADEPAHGANGANGATTSDAGADDEDAGARDHDKDQDKGKDAGSKPSPTTDAGSGDDKSSSHADPGSKPAPGTDAGSGNDKPGDPPAMGDPAPQPQPKPIDIPAGQHFFMPTIEATNTTAPTLLIDKAGATHALYPRYAGGGAFYAYCGKDCADRDDVKPVLLNTEGTVGNAALAVTTDGKPRALLSTSLRVYYAQCDHDCSETANWNVSVIVEHQGDKDVTGQALALDAQGHPRFLMHTYLAYLGVGQKAPATWYAQCDADCDQSANWQFDQIQDQIWFRSELQFDAAGTAHVLTGIENADGNSAGFKLGAYFECASGCSSETAWSGIGLVPLFENTYEEVHPSLAFAMTKQAQPRVVLLTRDDTYQRHLVYLECDQDCTEDNWSVSTLSDLKELGEGLDIVLDANDHPRFVFTLADNIGLYSCNDAHCSGDTADWQLTKVEFAGDLPKDSIILWPNCTVDAWVLHTPSLALGGDGARIGYEATDLSGGVKVIDETKPACIAGKDMTLSRMTIMSSPK